MILRIFARQKAAMTTAAMMIRTHQMYPGHVRLRPVRSMFGPRGERRMLSSTDV